MPHDSTAPDDLGLSRDDLIAAAGPFDPEPAPADDGGRGARTPHTCDG